MLRWLATCRLNNAAVVSMGVKQDRSDLLRQKDRDPTRCKFGYVGHDSLPCGRTRYRSQVFRTIEPGFEHPEERWR